jgi:hypothetical protein
MDDFNPAGGKLRETAKLTMIGSVFVGIGSLLNSYVPAFHVPVMWVDHVLHRTGHTLSQMPGSRLLFHDNPLTGSRTMREFLAVNIVESALIGGILIGGGAAMKVAGVKPKELEKLLSTNRGTPPRA